MPHDREDTRSGPGELRSRRSPSTEAATEPRPGAGRMRFPADRARPRRSGYRQYTCRPRPVGAVRCGAICRSGLCKFRRSRRAAKNRIPDAVLTYGIITVQYRKFASIARDCNLFVEIEPVRIRGLGRIFAGGFHRLPPNRPSPGTHSTYWAAQHDGRVKVVCQLRKAWSDVFHQELRFSGTGDARSW